MSADLTERLQRVLEEDFPDMIHADDAARLRSRAARLAEEVREWARPAAYEGDPFGPPLTEDEDLRLLAALADERDKLRGRAEKAERRYDDLADEVCREVEFGKPGSNYDPTCLWWRTGLAGRLHEQLPAMSEAILRRQP